MVITMRDHNGATFNAKKWLTTGASKGGMTATYHRRFFPKDVDGTVAYVAPNDVVNKEDSAYDRFLTNVGTDTTCRDHLRGLQRALLTHRDAIEANLDQSQAFDDDDDELRSRKPTPAGFSSGERQLRSLEEIVRHTDAAIYLLDEWDANLDSSNRAMADALVEQLAQRARVVEISHRDRG